MISNVLANSFKLTEFRKGQREIIETILAKRDTLAVLPTGGGKSLCYQLPAVFLKQLIVVVSPLIALMKDQVFSLRSKNISSGCFYSGQTDDEKKLIFQEINRGGTYVLYLSPERVQKEGFQKWILNRQIGLFAVDEAHCVSQWGHDFREEYASLDILKKLRPDVPVLALTASATPFVLDDIAKNLNLHKPSRIVHGFYRPNLYYQVETCLTDDEKMQWLKQSLVQTPTGRALVYCGTRKVTEELCVFLQRHFIDVGYYHAGLSHQQRTNVQSAYQTGAIRILVATNAFGMGIDQPDVRLVVHFQMPANIDSLYQEMGRAGRDGKDSTCLMLYSKKDKGLQSFFIQNSTALKAIKNLKWSNLEALVSYSEANECRHSEILTYFKDSQRLKKCGHCDVCDAMSTRKIKEPVFEKTIAAVKNKKAKTMTFGDSGELTPVQEKIFQSLRDWRKAKASELDVPAFVIFGDKTLRDLARKNPKVIDDLMGVYGIGEAKLEKFGAEVLAQILLV
jgi:ATP-dependent DNA helicase RecQ